MDKLTIEQWVALFTIAWAIPAFFINARRENHAWLMDLFSQLKEMGTTILEKPGIQRFLCKTYDSPVDYFKANGSVERDDLFLQAKTFVYWHLNVFDSVVGRLKLHEKPSTPWGRLTRWLNRTLFYPSFAEIADWEKYIEARLQHPFFQAVLEEEGHIFGKALLAFYNDRKPTLKEPPLQYLW
jgi:hypothetical protein